MTKQKTLHRKELSGTSRSLLALLGVGLAILLGVAACLSPNPWHFGTHEQLGLPPCSFYVLFGVPCPTCGMTTSWAHLMHGEIVNAFRTNAGGAILGLLAILAAPWSIAVAIRGKPVMWMPNGYAFLATAISILVVVLLQWGCLLAMHLHR